MDRRGIIFTLFLFLVLSLVFIVGLLYLKVRFFDGFEFKTGNFVVKLDYEKEETKMENVSNISSEGSTDKNFSIEEINGSSYINISTE